MGLIKNIAFKYTTKFLETDDLIQDGILGMIEGIKHYNPSRGKLSTAVYWYILSAINRSIQNTENTVRIPASVKKGKKYNKDYTDRVMSAISLENTALNNGGCCSSTFKDLLPAIDNTENECINGLLGENIIEGLHRFLHGRELDVIKKSCLEGRSLKSIAGDYGSSFQYIQQLRREGLAKLRLVLKYDDYREVI